MCVIYVKLPYPHIATSFFCPLLQVSYTSIDGIYTLSLTLSTYYLIECRGQLHVSVVQNTCPLSSYYLIEGPSPHPSLPLPGI